jgi:hypothetical protein
MQDYEDRLSDKKPITAVTARVKSAMARIRLNLVLDEAAGAEQRGDRAEAVRLYREAASALKGLESDTPARSDRLAKIEEKAKKLSGPA